jgi:hypothetical protein
VATGSTNTIIRNSNEINGNEVGILMLSPVIVDDNTIQNNKSVGILINLPIPVLPEIEFLETGKAFPWNSKPLISQSLNVTKATINLVSLRVVK